MEGQFLASVGTKGKGPLQFERPVSIMVHPNGQVLISEAHSNRIQVLNQDLTFSHSFTTRGSPRGKGQGHFGMAVDSQGIVYVTDREMAVSRSSPFLASTWDSLVVWVSGKETSTLRAVLQLMTKITCISVSQSFKEYQYSPVRENLSGTFMWLVKRKS